MTRRSSQDFGIAFLLLLTCLLFAHYFVDFSIPPFEDAAMLMRYALHLAEGHGIVWNIGEAPVDGATDFLFMLVVALFTRAGVSVEFATRSLSFAAHIATVLLIYITLRRVYASGIYSAVLSSLYLAVGPGLFFVAAYFGTPFFTLAVCATWIAALRLTRKPDSRARALMFSLLSLIIGLIRPEGVFLAGFMLLALIVLLGLKKSQAVILSFLLVYGLCGGIYFLWRWQYFGYPLPNPFYKKGGGLLYPKSLETSIKYVRRLCLPFLLAFVPGILMKSTFRKTLAFLIPIVGFTGLWILLSNEMNFGGRFQYSVLPIVLLSWYPLLQEYPHKFTQLQGMQSNGKIRLIAIPILSLLFVGLLHYQYKRSSRITYHKDGRYDMAVMLSDYHKKEYTIATTEAGLLPLYSRWRAIDTWGLNDQWITHNKGITEEYLLENAPQLIVWHEDHSSENAPISARDQEWFNMIDVLKAYVQKYHYEPAALFGESREKTHRYYVSRDFPESQEIIKKIRSTDYSWYRSGHKSRNFALTQQEQE